MAAQAKAFLEGQARWRANNKRIVGILADLRRQAKRFQRGFRSGMRTLAEHGRQIRKLEARQEASLRVLRRLLKR